VVILIPQFEKVKTNLSSTSPWARIQKLQPQRRRFSEKLRFVNSFFLKFCFFTHNIKYLFMGRRRMNG